MTPNSVFEPKPNAVLSTFGHSKAVIGVIHCLPLPGSPKYDGAAPEALIAHAVEEAQRYERGGVHGLIVENHGDIPFAKPADLGPETAAMMSVIVDRVRARVALPVGVNVLANGAIQALAIAHAAGGAFIRVNQWANAYVANEGLIEGPAAAATRYRSWLHARGVKVFADVHVKHGAHAIVADRSLAELTRDVEFFDADVVIATGQRTGDAADLEEVRAIARATDLPIVIGSGVTVENAGALLEVVDGLIVASSLKEEGVWWTPVSERKVAAFMASVADHLGG
jgi:uncharacterized protein